MLSKNKIPILAANLIRTRGWGNVSAHLLGILQQVNFFFFFSLTPYQHIPA